MNADEVMKQMDAVRIALEGDGDRDGDALGIMIDGWMQCIEELRATPEKPSLLSKAVDAARGFNP